MKKEISIVLFCDALGYELAQRHRVLAAELPVRRAVRTQFGYSSTAVPTILSGEPPTVHRHFSFFFYDRPGRSPFRFFRWLAPLLRPARLFNHHRIRHRISRMLARYFGFTGYFQLYRVPFDRLPLLDYCEKKDIFASGGLAPAANLRDMLQGVGVPFFISDWRQGDDANFAAAEAALEREEAAFYFVYTAGIDGMLHFHVGDDAAVAAAFDAYAGKVRRLLDTAHRHAETVRFFLISDHGMTPLRGSVDLKTRLEGAGFRFGRDFVACYDSTMLRLYCLNPACREPLMRALDGAPGHWLSDAEKKSFHIDFADAQYGDEIFLLDPGVQLTPGDMGGRPIPGMHGYSPEDADSTAALLANVEPEPEPAEIADFFRLMKHEAERLRS